MRRFVVSISTVILLLLVLLATSVEGRTPATTAIPTTPVEGPHAVQTVPLSAEASLNEIELMYDSGPEVYAPDDDVLNAEWAVWFTPPQACSLVYVDVMTYETSSLMGLTVYADDGAGFPGDVLDGPYQFQASGDLSEQRLEFPSPIDVGEGDFHIGIQILEMPTAHPVFDNDGGTLHTLYRQEGTDWQPVDNIDMVMRAYVRTYGEDITKPNLLHIPITIAFSADANYPVTARILDQSGISEATVHYSTDGVNYQSATLTESSGLFNGMIPGFPGGTTVDYYLTAKDDAPAYNTAVLPEQGAIDPFSFTVQSGRELRWDDGLPEEFWIESDIYDGNAFAVQFYPPSFPAVISHIRALVDDTTSFALAIQKSVAGVPGDVLAGPFLISADPYSGWADFTIPVAQRPTLTTGGFAVVLYWLPSTPDLPAVATDVPTPYSASWWYDNSFGWNQYAGGTWIMRAAVETTTGVVELDAGGMPHDYRLGQNTPNPFNISTAIRFSLPQTTDVSLQIYNVLGQSVRQLQTGEMSPGEYSIEWDGRDEKGHVMNTGVYFYRLQTNNFAETRKMLLLK